MTGLSAVTAEHLEIRRGYEPGLIGRVGELHGRYYIMRRPGRFSSV